MAPDDGELNGLFPKLSNKVVDFFMNLTAAEWKIIDHVKRGDL